MTYAPLSGFYSAPETAEFVRNVDAVKLEKDLDLPTTADLNSEFAHLRVAAIAATTDLAILNSLDFWFRESNINEELEFLAKEAFTKWGGYLNALSELDEEPDVNDLLFFSFTGLLARRPNEVRDFLRRENSRKWVDFIEQSLGRLDWIEKVRAYINLAILLVIRQENRTDVQASGRTIQILAQIQKDCEPNWLNARNNQARDALELLGYYHIAQAVTRTSDFLLTGSIQLDGGVIKNILPELKRLSIRAEEYLECALNDESLVWVRAAALTLIELHNSSIWVQGRGISQGVDQLLDQLVAVGREQQVFSLLPSQQDAIRNFLFDQSRIAIILQMPTSAGKTLLAEFSIVQTFDAYRGRTRVAYVVPTRALATQVRRTLTEDLRPLQINVSAAGSAFEEDPYELELLNSSDGVVVSTPEKLDLMLRAHPEWFSDLRLVVVDEAHLLGEGDRGVRLELLLANIRREHPEARLLLLTPFVDNASQIATWLGQRRGHAISVHWRPVKILLGIADIRGRQPNRRLTIEWNDPFGQINPKDLVIPTTSSSRETSSTSAKVIFLAKRFNRLGTTLALYSGSPAEAEKAARDFSNDREKLKGSALTSQLKVAIALAKHEYGESSNLAYCLERGTAFHHSSLSPILRYLIEDQLRSKSISFVAATSTLAQGMNFPVATVIIHSVHKPYAGNFTSGEFWNIAGRAGRVGMVEKGLVIFANKEEHQSHYEYYGSALSGSIYSSLLQVLEKLSLTESLKEQYNQYPELRPFIQYLAHAAANSSPASALRNLEELVQQSLVNQQVGLGSGAKKLRDVARKYLGELTNERVGFLKVADTTGLGSFSFTELYAKLRNDPVLVAGPQTVLTRREQGMHSLVEALRWLPELDLAIGRGPGQMDVQSVARVVQGWIDGKQVHELAAAFPGSDENAQIRQAAKYIYSKVSQTISWGAHAYVRGWSMTNTLESSEARSVDSMLPAYIQYGVKTPEAAVASLLGIPRPFAEALGHEYRSVHGNLEPRAANQFKAFVEAADQKLWENVIRRSEVAIENVSDVRKVVRQIQGFVD